MKRALQYISVKIIISSRIKFVHTVGKFNRNFKYTPLPDKTPFSLFHFLTSNLHPCCISSLFYILMQCTLKYIVDERLITRNTTFKSHHIFNNLKDHIKSNNCWWSSFYWLLHNYSADCHARVQAGDHQSLTGFCSRLCPGTNILPSTFSFPVPVTVSPMLHVILVSEVCRTGLFDTTVPRLVF
jgi:hypothetical protein